jgi:multiple antibiotic resistance protein
MKDISAITFAVQSFVTLFVIMDPPGATPIFLGLVADKSPRVRRILAIQAAGVSLLVISIFALFGRAILNYLNISMEALQAAGALLLLLVALELLTGNAKKHGDDGDSNVALVPLGTPLLAGPGSSSNCGPRCNCRGLNGINHNFKCHQRIRRHAGCAYCRFIAGSYCRADAC